MTDYVDDPPVTVYIGNSTTTVVLSDQEITVIGPNVPGPPGPRGLDGAHQTGFTFFIGGRPSDGELLGSVIFTDDVIFSNSYESVARARIAAAATTHLSFVTTDDEGGELTVGTITFNAASLEGTVSWSPSTYTLPAGNMLRVYAANPADVALSYINCAITGNVS